jgi:hypothetical protein
VRFAGAIRSAGPGPAEIPVAVAAGACEVEGGGGELKLAVEFRADGTARVVVLRGWAELSRAGRSLARVEAGQEASIDAAGGLTGPALARDVSAFASVGEGD